MDSSRTDIGTYPIKFWAKVGEDSISKPDTIIVQRGYSVLEFNSAKYATFGDTNLADAGRQNLTVGLWVRVDTTGNDSSVFIGKGRRLDLIWNGRSDSGSHHHARFA